MSQETITSKVDVYSTTSWQKYDLKITHNFPSNWQMSEYTTFNLEIKIVNTNPVTNLEFDISEILGHQDVLSFGKPGVTFGNAYAHDDPYDTQENKGKLIHLEPFLSNSGIENNC